MKKWIAPALIALVVVGAGVFAYRAQSAVAAWEQRASQAVAFAESSGRQAVAFQAHAAGLELEVDSLRAALEENGRRIRTEVGEARAAEVVPDSCAPFIAWRDRVIDELVEDADGWAAALQKEQEAAALLRAAYNTVQTSNDSLVAVLEARPRPRSWWMPELGPGVFLGVDSNFKPTAGVGVTLQWRFK